MHKLHAALCMRIADALKAVARVGSPRLVAYGDLMFGRIYHPDAPAIPVAKLAGSTACRGRWHVTVADRVLDMLAAARLARRLSTDHQPG